MKALIQRVTEANVVVDGVVSGEIGRGLLVFLGVERGDTENDLDFIVKKIADLRIFEDEAGRMNFSVKDIEGGVLLVSQFTLAADCRKGNRPSFDCAEEPIRAKGMYMKAIEKFRAKGVPAETGKFAAHMRVSLVNDGPVTIILDSKKQSAT